MFSRRSILWIVTIAVLGFWVGEWVVNKLPAFLEERKLAEAWERCLNFGTKFSVDLQIDGCTATIERNKLLRFLGAEPYIKRANAYERKKDYERAIADYSKAIQSDPNSVEAFNDRGGLHLLKEDYDRAIADYSEAIRINPKAGLTLANRCWARAISGGNLVEALADCDRSLEFSPEEGTTKLNRSIVYFRLGRFDETIIDCNAILTFFPKSANALFLRGLARLKKGEQARGDADIIAAKAVDPSIAETYAKYGVKQ